MHARGVAHCGHSEIRRPTPAPRARRRRRSGGFGERSNPRVRAARGRRAVAPQCERVRDASAQQRARGIALRNAHANTRSYLLAVPPRSSARTPTKFNSESRRTRNLRVRVWTFSSCFFFSARALQSREDRRAMVLAPFPPPRAPAIRCAASSAASCMWPPGQPGAAAGATVPREGSHCSQGARRRDPTGARQWPCGGREGGVVERAGAAPHVAQRAPALCSPGARGGLARLLTLPRAACSLQLPLSLLRAGKDNPMLVELKNGETYNGILINCDIWYAPRAACAMAGNWAACGGVRVLWAGGSGRKHEASARVSLAWAG